MRWPPLLAALALAGCVIVLPQESVGGEGIRFPAPPAQAAQAPHARDAGDFVLVWPPDPGERFGGYREAVVAEEGVDDWIDILNGELALPRDLRIAHASCGVENAYYSFDDEQVVLCWELLDRIASTMARAGLREEEVASATGSAWLFVLFHEVGHALVDLYDLPVTGREEDAVDDLATLILIDAGAADAAIAAAVFWILTDDQAYSDAKFADEHSLNPQRFYTILCTVYGSDPSAYGDLVDYEYLPHERAQRCPREYEQKASSWGRLLEPWRREPVSPAGDTAG